jgi:hypothetical protein
MTRWNKKANVKKMRERSAPLKFWGMKSEDKMVIISLMWFHSIGYTPNWVEWKIEGMNGIGWNGFHHTPFHSIPFLQNQTMECGSIPSHSIPFHHSPPIQT